MKIQQTPLYKEAIDRPGKHCTGIFLDPADCKIHHNSDQYWSKAIIEQSQNSNDYRLAWVDGYTGQVILQTHYSRIGGTIPLVLESDGAFYLIMYGMAPDIEHKGTFYWHCIRENRLSNLEERISNLEASLRKDPKKPLEWALRSLLNQRRLWEVPAHV